MKVLEERIIEINLQNDQKPRYGNSVGNLVMQAKEKWEGSPDAIPRCWAPISKSGSSASLRIQCEINN